jgi:hypothetical protein
MNDEYGLIEEFVRRDRKKKSTKKENLRKVDNLAQL